MIGVLGASQKAAEERTNQEKGEDTAYRKKGKLSEVIMIHVVTTFCLSFVVVLQLFFLFYWFTSSE